MIVSPIQFYIFMFEAWNVAKGRKVQGGYFRKALYFRCFSLTAQLNKQLGLLPHALPKWRASQIGIGLRACDLKESIANFFLQEANDPWFLCG